MNRRMGVDDCRKKDGEKPQTWEHRLTTVAADSHLQWEDDDNERMDESTERDQ